MGKQISVTGWHLVLADLHSDADETGDTTTRSQVLPPLREGLSCPVIGIECKALKTLPPRPYTQGELVKTMKSVARLVSDLRLRQKLKDTVGIGAEATRANIISGLLARGYLVKKGRAVRASDAAFTLIDSVPAAIADPGMTAVWEQALDMIEAGQLTLEVFIEKQLSWVAQLVRQYRDVSLSIKVPQGPACPKRAVPRKQRGNTRHPDMP